MLIGDGQWCIMKTLTNGMELAWHPVVGGLVEGDQGHRAAVGDVRHEPGGEDHGVVEESVMAEEGYQDKTDSRSGEAFHGHHKYIVRWIILIFC